MIFLDFDWEHKFAITSVLAECRDIHVPTNLVIGSLQTFANRVNFQGTPQSSVDISFWYLKQLQRRDHNRADSCAPAACTRRRPGSSLDNKLVSNSTCAQVHFHREQATQWDRSAAIQSSQTIPLVCEDRMRAFLSQAVVHKHLLHDHHMPGIPSDPCNAHALVFTFLVSSAVPLPHHNHISLLTTKLWSLSYLLKSLP